MSNGALAILEIFKDAPPLRWYHFIAPLGVAGFILFCVVYTLWHILT